VTSEPNYGTVLDGRESETRHVTPGRARVGDLHVSFDGWFVRGHEITEIEYLGKSSYRIKQASGTNGRPYTFRISSYDKIQVLPRESVGEAA